MAPKFSTELTKAYLNECLDFLFKLRSEQKFLLKLLGISFSSLVLAYFGKVWYSYGFFKRLGIPTPKYTFFFGNFPELRKRNHSEVLKNWTQQYGSIYGYYEGHYPILVTSDLDFIREVFIKQYSNFAARKQAHVAPDDDDEMVNLFHSTKSRWKRMRNIMNPTFSSSKLKELTPLMMICVDRLVKALDRKVDRNSNEEINVVNHYKRFTMDTIWNCAFGIDINLQLDETPNLYFKKCEAVFQDSVDLPSYHYVGIYFHELKHSLFSLLLFLNKILNMLGNNKYQNPLLWLRSQVINIVDKRKNEKLQRNDYLKILLEAQAKDLEINADSKNFEMSKLHYEKKLTINEIKTNLVLFMLAGYETTSTALSYSSYVLAKHPQEQTILYEEILTTFSTDSNTIDVKSIDFDSIQKLKYLDLFVKEVLRMYPIANSVVMRRCTTETRINGLLIPVGLIIMIDVLSIHNNQNLWGPVDPEKFYPKRFSKEFKRDPLAFLGFGLGPRNCIGMKFALQELKYALVKLILNYEFTAGPSMPKELEYNEGIVRTPKYGVNICLKRRQNIFS